jgi:hypothetical protein
MSCVTITRKLSQVQPYPQNGNVSTQKPTYEWWVTIQGHNKSIEPTLKRAKAVAKDYGDENPKIVR